MPRKYRIEVPGGTFHIGTGAVYEAFAFGDVGDRHDFLELFECVVETYGWRCKTYCLMGTHYHVVAQTPEPNLSRGVQMLNGRYAQRFNGRHGRRGHLFGARFYSVLLETDAHLFAALRYVALNPVRAGLCATPAEWRWSSFRAIAGLEPAPRFLDVDGVLSLFGMRRQAARAAYAQFVEGMPQLDPSLEDHLLKMDGV
jgi:REP element-mobilizing transposase RayT